jgi:hypothetical protein
MCLPAKKICDVGQAGFCAQHVYCSCSPSVVLPAAGEAVGQLVGGVALLFSCDHPPPRAYSACLTDRADHLCTPAARQCGCVRVFNTQVRSGTHVWCVWEDELAVLEVRCPLCTHRGPAITRVTQTVQHDDGTWGGRRVLGGGGGAAGAGGETGGRGGVGRNFVIVVCALDVVILSTASCCGLLVKCTAAHALVVVTPCRYYYRAAQQTWCIPERNHTCMLLPCI